MSKYIRNTLCAVGAIAGFISAGMSDGATLLGIESGATDILFWLAIAMMLPTLIHIVKEEF